MKDAPKYPLVVIEWDDHSGDASGGTWRDMTDVKASNDSRGACFSVGWLVAEAASRVTLVPHLVPETSRMPEQGAGHMTIERALIRKMRRLRLPK